MNQRHLLSCYMRLQFGKDLRSLIDREVDRSGFAVTNLVHCMAPICALATQIDCVNLVPGSKLGQQGRTSTVVAFLGPLVGGFRVPSGVRHTSQNNPGTFCSDRRIRGDPCRTGFVAHPNDDVRIGRVIFALAVSGGHGVDRAAGVIARVIRCDSTEP